MKITVTLDHLKRARQKRNDNFSLVSDRCPIALALKDVGFNEVSVGWNGKFHPVYLDRGRSGLPLSDGAEEIAEAFDKDSSTPVSKKLFPCTFEIPD